MKSSFIWWHHHPLMSVRNSVFWLVLFCSSTLPSISDAHQDEWYSRHPIQLIHFFGHHLCHPAMFSLEFDTNTTFQMLSLPFPFSSESTFLIHIPTLQTKLFTICFFTLGDIAFNVSRLFYFLSNWRLIWPKQYRSRHLSYIFHRMKWGYHPKYISTYTVLIMPGQISNGTSHITWLCIVCRCNVM